MAGEEVRKRIAAGEDSRTQFKREPIGVAKLAAGQNFNSIGKPLISEGAIQMNPGINRKRLATLCGLTDKTIGRQVKLLRGRVEFRGAPKTGGYYVKGAGKDA